MPQNYGNFFFPFLKSLKKRIGSGSISQRYDESPDPDPHQNVTDPQHWFYRRFIVTYGLQHSSVIYNYSIKPKKVKFYLKRGTLPLENGLKIIPQNQTWFNIFFCGTGTVRHWIPYFENQSCGSWFNDSGSNPDSDPQHWWKCIRICIKLMQIHNPA